MTAAVSLDGMVFSGRPAGLACAIWLDPRLADQGPALWCP